MSFNGLTAKSTLDQVITKFPSATRDSICKGRTGPSSEGPVLCEFVKLSYYQLGGYTFGVDFFFRPNSTLKTLTLRWPATWDREARPTKDQIEKAKLFFDDLFASKYGSPLARPVCVLAGENCTEWLVNGSDPDLGGDRIQIRAETKFADFSDLEITYQFADFGEYNRF